MKRAAYLFLLLFVPCGFSQSTAKRHFSNPNFSLPPFVALRSSCPLRLLEASFHRPAKLMLAAAGDDVSPSLTLQMESPGIKQIKSVDVTVRARSKRSRYALDSAPWDIPMTLSGDSVAAFGKSNAVLQLPENVLAIDWVLAYKINYEDGSSWKSRVVPPSASPESRIEQPSGSQCGFWSRSQDTLRVIR